MFFKLSGDEKTVGVRQSVIELVLQHREGVRTIISVQSVASDFVGVHVANQE